MPVSKSTQSIMPQGVTLPGFPEPFWLAQDAALYLGDVRACLRRLPPRSVHACITSPPYWGLRDYGNDKTLEIGAEPSPDCGTGGQAQCGACFVCSMVGVFREVHRVLRDDGTCWLNLGDTFGDGGNLVGVPWRVALALQADGWVLRQDIIWYSPNKMPESVQNRCGKSHEHIFLLAKGEGYYFDSTAIQEPAKSGDAGLLAGGAYSLPGQAPHSNARDAVVRGKRRGGGAAFGKSVNRGGAIDPGVQNREYDRDDADTVNKRDVWIVPTTGYPGAHFAVYSPRLITPCILAGTSEHGVCAACGRPWERVVMRVGAVKGEGDASGWKRDRSFRDSRNGVDSTLDLGIPQRETVGWRKACGCSADAVAPALVLDPFVGSGTTVATALQLGRAGVGIDLSETYLRENAIPRIEAALSGEKVRRITAALRPGTPPPTQKLRGT